MPPSSSSGPTQRELLAPLLGAGGFRADRLVHVEWVDPRPGRTADWPEWVHPDVRSALSAAGIREPWAHQVATAQAAHAGRHVVVATGTASGKTAAFWLPALSALAQGRHAPTGRGATALYLSPTKALAHDQRRAVDALAVPGVRVASYDGDTPREERDWARAHATYLLTNPDMVHRALLPRHTTWAPFLRALRFVVVDECHAYRGVFGAHVSAVLRRLLRTAGRYGADPVVVLASATAGDPGRTAERLIGVPVEAVTDDASPSGGALVAFWSPPLTDQVGEHGAPLRRSATAETADLLVDLVVAGRRSLAFVRSRRGVETVASMVRDHLDEAAPGLSDRVAAYRAGFLPEERRALEARLRSGDLLGLATTSALELGIDVHGLDAVLVAGWPGRLASFWQQVGRAGRHGTPALAAFVARDDPLDTYLVHHPEAVVGAPLDATVLDPDNPYVLRPHLCAAAAEWPLRPDELGTFGPRAESVLDELVAGGLLRRRAAGWFWTGREHPHDLADLRGLGDGLVRVVEEGTGRLLGTVEAAAAHATVHEGAVYVHQGATYVVRTFDLTGSVALVVPALVDHTTHAREVSDLRVVEVAETRPWGAVQVHFGSVEVTSVVVSFLRRRLLTGEVLGETPLDLPPRTLRTAAVWWTLPAQVLADAGLCEADVPGAAHAAEHAAIGLLPLLAGCDRWDVGGLSTPLHPDTGVATVFVHDGQPGGAGFSERGFRVAGEWLAATADLLRTCPCPHGCPGCVQSPKCGNGNEPLDKAGALRLLTTVLSGAGPDLPAA